MSGQVRISRHTLQNLVTHRVSSACISRAIDDKKTALRIGTRGLSLSRDEIYWSDEIQLSFQITVYSLLTRSQGGFLYTKVRVRRLLSALPGPSLPERERDSAGVWARLHFACRAVCPH